MLQMLREEEGEGVWDFTRECPVKFAQRQLWNFRNVSIVIVALTRQKGKHVPRSKFNCAIAQLKGKCMTVFLNVYKESIYCLLGIDDRPCTVCV